MKLTIRCTCRPGCVEEIEIDTCCPIIVEPPPPPPPAPGLSFLFDAPAGEAVGVGYKLSRVLREFSAYGETLGNMTPVGAVPWISSTTYGAVAPEFITFPDCAPGHFPTAELYSNGVWHVTVAFLRNPDGRVFLIPAYGATYLPEDTVTISMSLPVCALPTAQQEGHYEN